MRVLVCPTTFKESLDVKTVLEAMVTGVRRARPDAGVTAIAVSDGGSGLMDALELAEGGRTREYVVAGPVGDAVKARCLWLAQDEVAIEAAEACGLHLLPTERRDPLGAHTRGVGELVAACLAEGARTLWIGLGGSGTVDGGTGMAAALGYRFLNAAGEELPAGGGALAELDRIAPGPRPAASVTALADVRSPLLGPDGAARRFASQKGAGPDQIGQLETGLARLSGRIGSDLGLQVADLPGAGAAGGLGAGCVAFLGSELSSGSEWVLRRTGFDVALAAADLVVTGEGAYDPTSGLGKVVYEIVERAVAADVPVVLACGRVEGGGVPVGVKAVDGRGGWLEASDVADLVAHALG
jgi:glycerate kinase